MADVDPYTFADASKADQLRFLRQQYAEAATAKEVTDGRKRVTRQDLTMLKKQIDDLEQDIVAETSGGRMHVVHTQHARR